MGPLVSADVLRKIERQIEDLDQRPSTLGCRQRPAVAVDCRGRRTAQRPSPSDAELAWWASAYERSCHDHQADLLHLAAWLALPAPPAGFWNAALPSQASRSANCARLLERLDTAATLRDVAELASRLRARPLDRGGTRQATSAETKDLARAVRAPRLADCSRACRGADPDVGGSRRPVPRTGRHGFRLALRLHARLVRDRLQRQRAAARRQLLRSAGLRGAAGQLHGRRPGQFRPGALVRTRAGC